MKGHGVLSVWRALEIEYEKSNSGPFSQDLIHEAIDRGQKLEQLLRLSLRWREATMKGYEIGLIISAIQNLSKELERKA